ncbi:MAG: DUF423 domain-containing protein [Chloroflexi bacterium]|nr:DUF423 domain-containing protein [Chloroflexota bacterium]MCI0785922.1 DUF423 domain-containing protein [Chloroflexota bacterium]MCI0824834.1 DUF423 domain-containing protein [Chloroflexota bacterium]MCI0866030.1 DUF423 domain-containing protein [Chloroflexota bacterium]
MRLWIAVGAIFGLLSVVAGALAVHSLRGVLEAGALDTFGTAARFQMYHALALLATGLLADRLRSRLITLAGGLFTAGTVIFSGSLYILALTGIGAFGAVAPVGGLSLIAGWTALIFGILGHKGRQ